MSRYAKLIWLSGLASLIFGACETTEHHAEVPALLADTNADTAAELTDIVSKALNGKPVNLAKDVLTQKPTLIIERAPMRSINNNPMMGRRVELPDHFKLSMVKNTCMLTHVETGERYPLTKANCTPVVDEHPAK
jgi:hypothetical protein